MTTSRSRRPRLAYAVTQAVTARVFLRGQLAYMQREGFDVSVISGDDRGELPALAAREGVATHALQMARDMKPAADLRSLLEMTRLLRKLEPDILNASTPKAGLLGMMAARALGVPTRVYLLRGLRLETEAGLRRGILASTERVAVGCANEVVSVSPSLRGAIVAGGFAPASRVRVLGHGASNGVDANRFAPSAALHQRARELRAELAIPDDALVVGFLGRPVADKGVIELAAAMRMVWSKLPGTRLLLVGATFAGDEAHPAMKQFAANPRVIDVGQVDDPAPYYQLMDLLAFPSKREGFPNAPLEAAASAKPVVGFAATGTRDCVASGETGELVAVGDVRALAQALVHYLRDPELRRSHGEAGRRRVLAHFTHERVWRAWADFYRECIDRHGPASISRTASAPSP